MKERIDDNKAIDKSENKTTNERLEKGRKKIAENDLDDRAELIHDALQYLDDEILEETEKLRKISNVSKLEEEQSSVPSKQTFFFHAESKREAKKNIMKDFQKTKKSNMYLRLRQVFVC